MALAAQWQSLDIRQRVIAGLAGLAAVAAVLAIAALASRPSMALLYAGLSGTASGDVLAALDQRGVPYEIRGDAIFVPDAQRDTLRMALAGEGLPAAGPAGYELLETLSGFGTTSQMFDAAYWRAKEGELARTIAASPSVRSARVHIATPDNRRFGPEGAPSASVTVTTGGGPISPDQARAFRHLVASAVSGLAPEAVSVIDAERGLVPAGGEAPGLAAEDRGTALRDSVLRLLEARVGPGNAVVEVTVDTVTETESIVERRFDPDGRVAISTETEERSESSNDSRGAGVTVASNLPSGDAGGTEGASQSQNSETRERTNFEVSETTREVTRAPGAVRRLSVAVLVNGAETTNPDGSTTWAPRPAEELTVLRALVASAVGLDEARGDVLTIESMPFETLPLQGTEAVSTLGANLGIDVTGLAYAAILAVVAIVLGLFVLRPILTRQAPAPGPLLPAPNAGPPPLTGEIVDRDFEPPPFAVAPAFGLGSGAPGLPAMASASSEAVERLKRVVEERRAETLEVLRGWMDETGAERTR